jgi:hypothetical protein
MAYIVGNNQPVSKMLLDLDTLMQANGWVKKEADIISSITTSYGFTYLGKAHSAPGKYSDTTGVKFSSGDFMRSEGNVNIDDTTGSFFSQFPTEFSISFWVKGGDNPHLANGVSNYNTGYFASTLLPLFLPYTNTTEHRNGIPLTFSRQLGIGGNYPVCSYFQAVEQAFVDKTGRSYELVTYTYSNITKELAVYSNGVYMGKEVLTSAIDSKFYGYTLYPAFYALGGQDLTIDQLIIWGKVLTAAEVLALSVKTTKVLSTDTYVFDILTEHIGTSSLGFYTSKASNGSYITVGLHYVSSTNNLTLINPFFKADTTKYRNRQTKPPVRYIEREQDYDYPYLNAETDTTFYPLYATDYTRFYTTTKYIMPLMAPQELVSKYWLTVDNDRITIAYKLQNIAAARSTPLYCLGYMGKLESVGNDSGQVFTAAMTTSPTYDWTTISSTLRSGVYYAANSMLRSSSYIVPTITSTIDNVVGLTSLSTLSFISPILVGGTYITHGSIRGVYLVPKQGTTIEDIITVGTTDYVVLADGDNTTSNYNLLLRLE